MSYPLDEQGLSCFVQESNPHLEGRSLLSYPLNERSKSTQTDLNRPKRCCRPFWPPDHAYMAARAGFEPADAGVKVLCLAAWLPGSVQVPHTVPGVRFGSRLLPLSCPWCHVRLPSVLYAAFSLSIIRRRPPPLQAADECVF